MFERDLSQIYTRSEMWAVFTQFGFPTDRLIGVRKHSPPYSLTFFSKTDS